MAATIALSAFVFLFEMWRALTGVGLYRSVSGSAQYLPGSLIRFRELKSFTRSSHAFLPFRRSMRLMETQRKSYRSWQYLTILNTQRLHAIAIMGSYPLVIGSRKDGINRCGTVICPTSRRYVHRHASVTVTDGSSGPGVAPSNHHCKFAGYLLFCHAEIYLMVPVRTIDCQEVGPFVEDLQCGIPTECR